MFDHGLVALHQLDQQRKLHALAERLRRVDPHPPSTLLPTSPALAPLFPAGSLRTGAAYAVARSTALATALLAGPAGAGAWCGVVGLPSFGIEAAVELGLDPDRLVLIPDPGQSWLQVLAACIDVLGVVLLVPPRRVHDAEAARLSGRLRDRGATMVVLGDWPRSEARLWITESRWEGIGSGHGHLRRRQVTVTAEARTGRTGRATFWLAHPEHRVQPIEVQPIEVQPIEPVASGIG